MKLLILLQYQHLIQNANIHAAVTSVSPVKEGRSSINFDGTLTDGVPECVWLGLALSRERSWPLLQQEPIMGSCLQIAVNQYT